MDSISGGITKIKDKKRKIHETFGAAGMLAVVGGFLDAYTYILRGGVFANAQTGNIVLLGINFAEGHFHQAFYYLIPIMAFSAGVLVNAMLKRHFNKKKYKVYEHLVLLVEIILLIIIAFLPLSIPNSLINVTVSFVCSLQVNAFRMVRELPYASTMCTGNLRSCMEKLNLYLETKNKKILYDAFHYLGIILLFICGAALGTITIRFFGTYSILLCVTILFVIYIMMRRESINSRNMVQ